MNKDEVVKDAKRILRKHWGKNFNENWRKLMSSIIGTTSSNTRPTTTVLDRIYSYSPNVNYPLSALTKYTGTVGGSPLSLTNLNAGAGTITLGSTDGVDKTGRCAVFSQTSATNGKYLLSNGGSSIPSTTFTISFWIKTTTATTPIMSTGGTAYGYQVLLSSGKVYVSDYTITSNVVAESSVATVNDGRWRHVAIVQSAAGNYFKIYIDGVEDHSTVGYYSSRSADAQWIAIGAALNYGAVFQGSLCMPTVIVGTALTAANIQNLAGL